ncbi:HEAT SHOCK PROTEIN [Salix koriyanagi]|uniref:HEAT SHOCK PROTEIN n=1 Tax=Salix koriyanagi TaxID=2511006 RepID=A0A9Q0X245_9ROSI|nr:HEAT SHOCK PROTEIN [Salix koriyanagi]
MKKKPQTLCSITTLLSPVLSPLYLLTSFTLVAISLASSCLSHPSNPSGFVDFRIEGLERCYLLDFIGPRGFASTLSRQSNCEVICFDHRKSSSSTSVYEYFSKKILDNNGGVEGLLKPEDQDRVEMVLKYIEDMDLRRWSLPDIRAFKCWNW